MSYMEPVYIWMDKHEKAQKEIDRLRGVIRDQEAGLEACHIQIDTLRAALEKISTLRFGHAVEAKQIAFDALRH